MALLNEYHLESKRPMKTKQFPGTNKLVTSGVDGQEGKSLAKRSQNAAPANAASASNRKSRPQPRQLQTSRNASSDKPHFKKGKQGASNSAGASKRIMKGSKEKVRTAGRLPDKNLLTGSSSDDESDLLLFAKGREKSPGDLQVESCFNADFPNSLDDAKIKSPSPGSKLSQSKRSGCIPKLPVATVPAGLSHNDSSNNFGKEAQSVGAAERIAPCNFKPNTELAKQPEAGERSGIVPESKMDQRVQKPLEKGIGQDNCPGKISGKGFLKDGKKGALEGRLHEAKPEEASDKAKRKPQGKKEKPLSMASKDIAKGKKDQPVIIATKDMALKSEVEVDYSKLDCAETAPKKSCLLATTGKKAPEQSVLGKSCLDSSAPSAEGLRTRPSLGKHSEGFRQNPLSSAQSSALLRARPSCDSDAGQKREGHGDDKDSQEIQPLLGLDGCTWTPADTDKVLEVLRVHGRDKAVLEVDHFNCFLSLLYVLSLICPALLPSFFASSLLPRVPVSR
jgi:hypothetical protein